MQRLLIALVLVFGGPVLAEQFDGPERSCGPGSEQFEYPVYKELTLPNLFHLPGYRNLKFPVYRSSGTEGPGILLVHGNSASSRAFVKQVFGSLGRRYRLILVDLPGFGRSEKIDPTVPFPTADGAPQGFPEYQLGLLEALAVVAQDPDLAPRVFVGWSLGGDALLLARGAGLLPAAKGFFLFGTAPSGASAPTSPTPYLPPVVPGLPLSILGSFGYAFRFDSAAPLGFDLEDSFRSPVPPYAPAPINEARDVGTAYTRAFFNSRERLSGRVPAFIKQDAFERSDARARGSIGAAALGALPPGSLPDELGVLATLGVPVAMLVGEQDAFVNIEYLRAIAAAHGLPTLWKGKVIQVPRAGHAIQYDEPELFERYLEDFVRDLPGH